MFSSSIQKCWTGDEWQLNRALYFLPALLHLNWRHHPPGSFTDPSAEGLSRERARERDRSRPHERRHHSSAGEKQRYYSCERYGSREQCHTKSAGPSRSTSPGEGQDAGLFKQVSYLLPPSVSCTPRHLWTVRHVSLFRLCRVFSSILEQSCNQCPFSSVAPNFRTMQLKNDSKEKPHQDLMICITICLCFLWLHLELFSLCICSTYWIFS